MFSYSTMLQVLKTILHTIPAYNILSSVQNLY